jgi:hypothetical protein
MATAWREFGRAVGRLYGGGLEQLDYALAGPSKGVDHGNAL